MRVVSRAVCAFACAVLISTSCVCAQEYKEASVDEQQASQKSAVLQSGNADQLKEFLRKYYLARWTVRANAQYLVKFREELEKDAVSISGAAQQTFLKEVVDALKGYAGSNSCYPACRYNAVLAMGTVNEVAGDRNGVGAVPYAGAITPLATFVSTSKETPDYVRLGALIGLVRHAEIGVKEEKMRNNLKSLFVKVLDPQYAKERGLRDDVYEWFQEKALQGLASFKSAEGAKGGTGTLDLFKRVIDDPSQKYELRCLAARAIGDMNLESVKNYDYAELAKSLTTLARDFCVDESAYIDEELVRDAVKSSANSMGGGLGCGMGGGGMAGGGMAGGGMAGGMGGGMDSMSGGLGGGMGGTIQNQKSLEAIVARIQYGFDSIRRAVSGVKNGGTGIQKLLLESDAAQKEAKEMLTKLLEEFDEMNTFISEGPKTGGGLGSGLGDYSGGMMNANSSIRVDANSMKDHLLEKKIKFNELLGIESY